MIEAIRSSETSVLTKATLRHIQEDSNLHSNRRENLRSKTVPKEISAGGKWPERKADHSFPSSVEVKNDGATILIPYIFMK
jgi:hypothetical protein